MGAVDIDVIPDDHGNYNRTGSGDSKVSSSWLNRISRQRAVNERSNSCFTKIWKALTLSPTETETQRKQESSHFSVFEALSLLFYGTTRKAGPCTSFRICDDEEERTPTEELEAASFCRANCNTERKNCSSDVKFYFSLFGSFNAILFVPACVGLLCFSYNILTIDSDLSSGFCGTSSLMSKSLSCPACEGDCRIPMMRSECFHSKASYLFDNPSLLLSSLATALGTALFLKKCVRAYAAKKYDTACRNLEINLIQETQAMRCTPSKNDVSPRGTPGTTVVMTAVYLLVTIAVHISVSRRIFQFYLSHLMDLKETTWLRASLKAAIINAFFVMTLGFVYRRLALKLTKREHLPTQALFERNYALRLYLFQVVNNFCFVFYVAFINGRTALVPGMKYFGLQRETPKHGGNLLDLNVQAAVLVAAIQSLRILRKLCQLCLNAYWKELEEKIASSPLLNEHHESTTKALLKFLPIGAFDLFFKTPSECSLTDDYVEIMLQFTFVILFAPVLPLTTLFIVLSNILIWRVEAYDYLLVSPHSLLSSVADFGFCLPIMKAAWGVSTFGNALILAFASDFVPRMVREFNGDILYNPLSICGAPRRYSAMMKCFDFDQANCRFPGFRSLHNSTTSVDCPKGCEALWWTIFSMRAEVAFLSVVISTLIKAGTSCIFPDVPEKLKQRMRIKAVEADIARFQQQCLLSSPSTSRESSISERSEGRIGPAMPNERGDCLELDII